MECGCTVITNLDEHSPAGLIHGGNVLDIHQCDRLPGLEEGQAIGRAARDVALGQYGWDSLVKQLRNAGEGVASTAARRRQWQER
jgi:hypothetical protein